MRPHPYHFQPQTPQQSQYRPPPIYPPPVRLNEISRAKKAGSAQYRTHFTLMNVYYPPASNYEQFITRTAEKLRKYINCDIIQISEIVDDDRVDLAIGVQSDKEAMLFLMKNQDIKIDTQKHGEESYKPIISNVFKIYMNAKKSLYAQVLVDIKKPPQDTAPSLTIQKSPKSQQKDNKNSSSYSSSRQSGSYTSSSSGSRSSSSSSRSNNKSSRSSQRSRSRDKIQSLNRNDSTMTKSSMICDEVWVFCVPMDIDEREVINALKERRVYAEYGGWGWRMVEDMEFLVVKLAQPLSVQYINSLDLRIFHYYPCIVMPKLKSDMEIRGQIRKYQSQLIFITPINENTLLNLITEVGGIVSIIKDDYFLEQLYILTFSKTDRVKKFQSQCLQVFGHKSYRTPQNPQPIRLCRVQKMFAMWHLIDSHNQKLKKIGN